MQLELTPVGVGQLAERVLVAGSRTGNRPLCHARKGESCRTQQGAPREVGGKATPHMQRVVAVSLAVALAQTAVVTWLRRVGRIVERLSGGLVEDLRQALG